MSESQELPKFVSVEQKISREEILRLGTEFWKTVEQAGIHLIIPKRTPKETWPRNVDIVRSLSCGEKSINNLADFYGVTSTRVKQLYERWAARMWKNLPEEDRKRFPLKLMFIDRRRKTILMKGD